MIWAPFISNDNRITTPKTGTMYFNTPNPLLNLY
nr:MAG TPA: hypothetical protein [Caudoviricetes sp.]